MFTLMEEAHGGARSSSSRPPSGSRLTSSLLSSPAAFFLSSFLLGFTPSLLHTSVSKSQTLVHSPPTPGGAGGGFRGTPGGSATTGGVCHHWSTSLVLGGSRETCRPHTPGLFSEVTKVHLVERPPGRCEGRLCAPPPQPVRGLCFRVFWAFARPRAAASAAMFAQIKDRLQQQSKER